MELDRIRLTLGVAAALLHVGAYVLYNVQAKFGKSKPNLASWTVWVVFATLNAISYGKMTADPYSALQFVSGSLACMITWCYALKIGCFKWPKTNEWYVLSLGCLAALVWWKYNHADWANLILLAGFVVSFKPTIDGVLRDSNVERPIPWWLWTIACGLTLINRTLAPQDSQVSELAHWLGIITPATLLILHGAVAVLSYAKRKEN